ncbi:hypothetical protein JTB14_023029 [Gonioctena quinquepunctata]|nr:hypothetical protein JTB14_023029 [Gonioctena quinquepunctata]
MTQDILLSIWMFRRCHERIMELSCYYVQYSNVIIMGYLTRRYKMRQVLDYISNYEKNPVNDHERNIYEKYAKLNRNVGFSIFFVITIAASIWYTSNTFQDDSVDDCPRERGLSFQIWYPGDLYNEHYWVTLIADLTFFAIVFFSLALIRTVTLTFMIFILGQIKVLQHMIKTMDENSIGFMKRKNITADDALLQMTVFCVEKQQEIQRLLSLVNNACKEFISIGFFSNSMELALFMMGLSILILETLSAVQTVRKFPYHRKCVHFTGDQGNPQPAETTEDSIIGVLRQMVILLMILSQLFLFLWFANDIKVEIIFKCHQTSHSSIDLPDEQIDESFIEFNLFIGFLSKSLRSKSSAIPNIIYTDTNWLSYNVRTRKILIMMMTRSQKPMTCYSAAIGEMTIETFKNASLVLVNCFRRYASLKNVIINYCQHLITILHQ